MANKKAQPNGPKSIQPPPKPPAKKPAKKPGKRR
jgi:hypothetical protein